VPGLGDDDILDADVLDVEAPAVEEDEVDEVTSLKTKMKKREKKRKKTRVSARLRRGREFLSSTSTNRRDSLKASLSYLMMNERVRPANESR